MLIQETGIGRSGNLFQYVERCQPKPAKLGQSSRSLTPSGQPAVRVSTGTKGHAVSYMPTPMSVFLSNRSRLSNLNLLDYTQNTDKSPQKQRLAILRLSGGVLGNQLQGWGSPAAGSTQRSSLGIMNTYVLQQLVNQHMMHIVIIIYIRTPWHIASIYKVMFGVS